MTHEGKRVVVGRQQLEGMINSPDTSVHITAEWRDRPRDGGMERAEGEGNKKEEASVVLRSARKPARGMRGDSEVEGEGSGQGQAFQWVVGRTEALDGWNFPSQRNQDDSD